MVLDNSGFNVDKMVEELKGLFNKQKSFNNPSSSTINPSPEGASVESSGGFQAPLKGSWKSSGGFDASSLRPNGKRGHMGVDMRAPAGTAIYPLAPGVVTNVGTDPVGGNIINIQHADGVRSYYAHLSAANVHKGDKVDNNTIIGAVGTSGNASKTWPHLHFQVWKDSQIQDPAKYFTVPAYTNLTPQEQKQGPWLSESAKQVAQNFNMKEHVDKRRVAFTKDVDQLVKVAIQFYLLSG